MTRLALAVGVAVQPLSGFPVTLTPRAGLAGYGAIEASDIREGISRLSRTFDSGSSR